MEKSSMDLIIILWYTTFIILYCTLKNCILKQFNFSIIVFTFYFVLIVPRVNLILKSFIWKHTKVCSACEKHNKAEAKLFFLIRMFF
jgi:hypothetical protein